MASSDARSTDLVVQAIAALCGDDEISLSDRALVILAAAIYLQRNPTSDTFLPGLELPAGRDRSLDSGRGHLITFEGMDGVGKSTVIDGVAGALAERGKEIVRMREPGGTRAGEKIREILLYKLDYEITPRAEAALFAAARAQNAADIIAPALARGAFVLSDRFVHSSVAYQGVARGLGAEQVADLSRYGLDGIWPSRTLMLTLSPEEAEIRRSSRRQSDTKSNDRIERAGDYFQRLVAAGFDYCLETDPVVVAVDAGGSPDEVVARALVALSDLI